MAQTLEDARQVVMALPDEERQLLAEEIIAARWPPKWREAWGVEVDRRMTRIKSGEDRTLTLDEFFSDEDVD
jgi:hypothetical protein